MSGHGWVTPNADGRKMRCGGPRICGACMREQAAKDAALQVDISNAATALQLSGVLTERKRIVAMLRHEIEQHPGAPGWITSWLDELERGE